MKLTLTESGVYRIEDTVIGAIAESQTLGDLVNNFDCLDFFIIYEDGLGNKEIFKIYYGGAYNADNYNRFMKHKVLPKVKLLSDHYDVIITADTFESECFVKVKKY